MGHELDPLLTAKGISAMLRISGAVLYREMDRSKLPKPLKLGTCSRWPRSEIIARSRRMLTGTIKFQTKPIHRPATTAAIQVTNENVPYGPLRHRARGNRHLPA